MALRLMTVLFILAELSNLFIPSNSTNAIALSYKTLIKGIAIPRKPKLIALTPQPSKRDRTVPNITKAITLYKTE
ncbi:hypothetical protein [Calothrix sp. UHCC 0171]|uniref:hypothetical protein n=1 Tax=Calothrix sp. UHCC 0171 TaxID=3110245 RepID=UPI002B2167E8|nr:hypothetical protein [Calothrix sp. UHCC 0171]MEA5574505.1 hypothetical protein [Calothrix sp. UHCC 0171]